MNKNEARRHGLSARRSLSQEQKERADEMILHHVQKSLSDCKVIACYASISDEVKTDLILEWCLMTGRILALPVTEEHTLSFYEVKSLQELVPGRFHVREPRKEKRIPIEECDVVLVPLSSVDKDGNRTGYGMGYYDSVLRAARLCIGLCYEGQIIEHMETDPWDVPLNGIITESGMHEVKEI